MKNQRAAAAILKEVPPAAPLAVLLSPMGSIAPAFNLPGGTKLKYQQENPRNVGTQTHYRYEIYKTSRTVGGAKDKGATAADFKLEREKGYVQVGT